MHLNLHCAKPNQPSSCSFLSQEMLYLLLKVQQNNFTLVAALRCGYPNTWGSSSCHNANCGSPFMPIVGVTSCCYDGSLFFPNSPTKTAHLSTAPGYVPSIMLLYCNGFQISESHGTISYPFFSHRSPTTILKSDTSQVTQPHNGSTTSQPTLPLPAVSLWNP